MSEPTAVAKREEQAVQPGDLLTVIATAAANPDVDPAKMQQLLDMQLQIEAERRRIEWHDAMSELQTQLPRVRKSGVIDMGGHGSIKYAKLEDIQMIAKPLLSAAGFSVAYDEETFDKVLKRVTVRISRRGHSEEFHAFVPIDDTGPGRNKTQAMASSSSYGRRRALINALNIELEGEDDDGAGGAEPITEDQVRDIESAITDFGPDYRVRLLKYMKVGDFPEILDRNLSKCMAAIEAKRKFEASR